AGAWSKLRAHAARFALILSRLRRACGPAARPGADGSHPWAMTGEEGSLHVELEDVQGAVALVDYFKDQLRRGGHAMPGGLASRDARDILAWIERRRRASFRLADVSSDLRRFREDPKALAEAIDALESAGAIRPREEPHRRRRGRTPTTAYEVHPDLLSAP